MSKDMEARVNYDELVEERDKLCSWLRTHEIAIEGQRQEIITLSKKCDALQAEVDEITAIRQQLGKALTREDVLQADLDTYQRSREKALQVGRELKEERDVLQAKLQRVREYFIHTLPDDGKGKVGYKECRACLSCWPMDIPDHHTDNCPLKETDD